MKAISAGVLAASALAIAAFSWGDGQWKPLENDGLHDPSNPSLKVMQEPAEALGVLKPDTAGNKVNWVAALQSGQINPRASLHGDFEPEILDLNVVMTETSPLSHVIFGHKPHTEWMACKTCHEDPFVSKIGANPINMGRILEGDYCGRCHGAVSFPLTECNRCHSVKPDNRPMAPPSGAVRDPGQ